MRNLILKISYDGTRYKGWQRLSGAITIQGKIEAVLSRVLDEEIEISGSGRTDAGAHALKQVASFHCKSTMETAEILRQLRAYLPDDIGIESCEEAGPRFHARLNAVTKTYRYRIWNSSAPCVFDYRYVYRMEQALNIDLMRKAAQAFLGTHDFLSFCSNKKYKKSTIRTIYSIDIQKNGSEVDITITGDGFLYNMVRIMVGTLIEVGTEKRDPDSISATLSEENRVAAGYTVPACGLCLMEVTY